MLVLAGLSLLILRSIVPSLLSTQVVFFCLGSVVFVMTNWWGIERWLKLAPVLYVGLILLLLVPLITGSTTRGIAGWIDVGTLFSIQPSQLAIPVVLLLVGPRLARFNGRDWRELLLLLGIAGLPAILIVIEPDLGTTLIYGAALGVAFWLSKLDFRYVLGFAGIAIVGSVIAWSLFLKPYQKQRIYSFISPTHAEGDAGYNARQALIAVGSGQLTGRGLGEGVQSHLRFLPERQTDFVFASLAEEMGFVGSFLVLSMYVMIVILTIRIGLISEHILAPYLAIATAVMFVTQAGVNIGMNMGLLPITGITLPLVSYGGSSIIAVTWLLGLVQSLLVFRPLRSSDHLS